jgi:CDP-6-deoxy-D-xylo-4-hexulose-3-dehydrase
MKGRNFHVSGELNNTNAVMKDTFWIGVQPALSENMLDFAASKIAQYIGIEF